MESPERERKQIVDYFLAESPEGTSVEHPEKIAVERVHGVPHDVWDVHGSDGRWWVITNPTNLHCAERFPSMDEAFAFHIGVTGRLIAREALDAPVREEHRGHLSQSWRRYEQATRAHNEGDEAEDFQAVGIRLREAPLSLVTDLANESLMVPEGDEAPKQGDFVNWTALIANGIAPGSRNARLRTYLKMTAKATWELVNWLTHDKNATQFDGLMTLDATANVLEAFSNATIRFERGEAERCPSCGSYQLSKDYEDDTYAEFAYCKVCDWEGPREPA
jgi:hypothetical protein